MRKSDQEKAEIRRATEARRQPGKDRSAHEAALGVKLGKSKTFTHIIRNPLNEEEFAEALAATTTESDRGVGIIGAAMIEEGLADAIATWLINAEDRDGLFYDVGAPFGTLRNKTIAAYALGICSSDMREQIDTIRTIRNLFSHALRPIDFKNKDIALLCNRLPLGKTDPVVYAERVKQHGAERMRFLAACLRIGKDLSKARMAKIEEQRDALFARLTVLESEAAGTKGSD